MDTGMSKQEQQNRLAAAYRRMSPGGRDALDRIIRKLAGLHTTVERTVSLRENESSHGERIVAAGIGRLEEYSVAVKRKDI
jgi:hypothetical protein